MGIKLEWYVINEETQLLAVFIAFCVTVYTQGGDAIHKALDQKAVDLLKEHNAAEDNVVAALEQKLEFLQAGKNMVNDFEAMNEIRAETYDKLNAAGAVKPQHDFKAQVERMLNMIAAEEASVTEKIKGGKAAADPVQAEFVKFFKAKAAEAKASKDDSEEVAQKEAMIAKMNSVAKNEGFFFEFDKAGKPALL